MKQVKTNIENQSQEAVTAVSVLDPSCGSGANTSLLSVEEDASNSIALAIASRHRIYQERLRQAQMSFNLAYGITAASAVVSFIGVLLLSSGNVSVGIPTTASGATSGTISAVWLKLAKDANDRLDKTAKVLEDKS